MNYSRADEIVGVFASLLENNEGRVWRSESELPAKKDDIKAAILVMGARLRDNGDLTPEGLDTLRTCYASLADFVPTKDAAKLGAFQKGISWWRVWRERGAQQPLPEIVTGGEELKAATDDYARLFTEFDARFNAHS